MDNPIHSELFFLVLLGYNYPFKMSKILGKSHSIIDRQVKSLEQEKLIHTKKEPQDNKTVYAINWDAIVERLIGLSNQIKIDYLKDIERVISESSETIELKQSELFEDLVKRRENLTSTFENRKCITYQRKKGVIIDVCPYIENIFSMSVINSTFPEKLVITEQEIENAKQFIKIFFEQYFYVDIVGQEYTGNNLDKLKMYYTPLSVVLRNLLDEISYTPLKDSLFEKLRVPLCRRPEYEIAIYLTERKLNRKPRWFQ